MIKYDVYNHYIYLARNNRLNLTVGAVCFFKFCSSHQANWLT